jgi:hypothetical protein
MTDDKVLTQEEYEIDEAILENLRLGYFEEVGLGDDGEMRYRLTDKGRRYVENMGKKKDPPAP